MLSLKSITIAILTAFLCATSACSKSSDSGGSSSESDATSNVVQTATAEASSQASSAEGGSIALASVSHGETQLSEIQIEDNSSAEIMSTSPVHQRSSCALSGVRSSCSNGVRTITWNSCTVAAGTQTMTGGWTETYSSNTCATTSSNTMTRTTTGSTSTHSSGATVTTDTNGGTTYDNTTIPNTGTTVTFGASTNTIVINGTHRVKTSAAGSKVFEHYITSSGLTHSGTLAAGTRSISGTVTVYHQLAKYKAVNTLSSVSWGSASCCYPTSGTVSTTLSGSLSGTTTTQFTATCGQATFTDTSGAQSTITLTQCN